MLTELLLEKVEVGRLPGETVPVLREDRRHAAGRHQVPHTVEAGPLERRPTLPRVQHFLQDLVALGGGVIVQAFGLLAQAVAAPGLLVR
jgi:hypothetical protein